MGKLNADDIHQELLFQPQPRLIERIIRRVSVEAGFTV